MAEITEEEEREAEKNRATHQVRATQIAEQCAFAYVQLSPQGIQACKMVELLFEEFTKELALLLPDQFRTAVCLQCLEEASMWAKKSITTYDKFVTDKEKVNGHNHDD